MPKKRKIKAKRPLQKKKKRRTRSCFRERKKKRLRNTPLPSLSLSSDLYGGKTFTAQLKPLEPFFPLCLSSSAPRLLPLKNCWQSWLHSATQRTMSELKHFAATAFLKFLDFGRNSFLICYHHQIFTHKEIWDHLKHEHILYLNYRINPIK